MALNDSDRFVVNDGASSSTITFAQFKDGTVLNDSDKFLVNDGSKTETITWAQIQDDLGPKGVVVTPTVLKPEDGAGSGDTRYLKSDTITAVEGGGISTCETDTIQSVDDTDPNNVVLTFPSSNGFDCFEPGDVVQGVDANQDAVWSQQASSEANLQPNSKAFDGNVDTFNQVAFSDGDSNIVFTLTPVPSGEVVEIKTQQEKEAGAIECNGVSITDDTNTPVITQCGRTTSSTLTIKQNINSGQASQDVNKIFYVKVGDQLLVDQGVAVDNAKIISKDEDANTITVDGGTWTTSDKLSKNIPYDTKLTVAGSTDLADMSGSVFATDGTGAPGPYTQTPYKLTTTDIESVVDISPYDGWKTGQDGNYNETVNLDDIEGDVENVFGPDADGTNYILASLENYGLEYTFQTPLTFDTPVDVFVGTGNGRIERQASINGGTLTAQNDSISSAKFADGTNCPISGNNNGTLFTGVTALSKVATQWDYSAANGRSQMWGVFIDFKDGNGFIYIRQGDGIISDAVGGKLLTFPGDVSTNPDLQYFKAGDEVQSGVSVVSTGYPDSNTMVVDGGAWAGSDGSGDVAPDVDDTVDWSSTIMLYDAGNNNLAFDNDLTTVAEGASGSEINIIFQADPPAPITTFEIYTKTRSGAIQGNGTDNTYKVNIDKENWYTYSPPNGFKNGTSLSIDCRGTSSTPSIAAFRINGKIAVNNNYVPPTPGQTSIEYQTNGGQGDIVSVNTDDNTLLIVNTGDRDNRWIAQNKAGTVFAVAGPSIVDDPLLTTNVELESTPFATLPADVDGLKEIIWEINGVEQSAGTNNPYKPTGLPLNTDVTVRVKHLAAQLDPSEWSTSVTFTTGASRTLREHYEARIAELGG